MPNNIKFDQQSSPCQLPVPEKYANKPNLWRLACELVKFEDPNQALGLLKTAIRQAEPMLRQEQGVQHVQS